MTWAKDEARAWVSRVCRRRQEDEAELLTSCTPEDPEQQEEGGNVSQRARPVQ